MYPNGGSRKRSRARSHSGGVSGLNTSHADFDDQGGSSSSVSQGFKGHHYTTDRPTDWQTIRQTDWLTDHSTKTARQQRQQQQLKQQITTPPLPMPHHHRRLVPPPPTPPHRLRTSRAAYPRPRPHRIPPELAPASRPSQRVHGRGRDELQLRERCYQRGGQQRVKRVATFANLGPVSAVGSGCLATSFQLTETQATARPVVAAAAAAMGEPRIAPRAPCL